MTVRILIGDVRERLRELADESVHCVVTSPPYWGLRDYGVAGQIGLEEDFGAYLNTMVEVFGDLRRVLRQDGTAWVNLGDCYAGSWGAQSRGEAPGPLSKLSGGQVYAAPKGSHTGSIKRTPGLKPKDLVGMPWRVAFALQADGWWLRSEIIWHKPNPMPESVTDRPTNAHEKVFLLSKAERYFYDAEAVKEPSVTDDPRRPYGSQGAWDIDGRPKEMRPNGKLRAPANRKRGEFAGKTNALPGREAFRAFTETRNLRNVWTIPVAPFAGAHFATFPPELPELCIKAGCPASGTVLDPFGGAGTTGLVADRLGRSAILIELNPVYAAMAERRIRGDTPLFADVSAG